MREIKRCPRITWWDFDDIVTTGPIMDNLAVYHMTQGWISMWNLKGNEYIRYVNGEIPWLLN